MRRLRHLRAWIPLYTFPNMVQTGIVFISPIIGVPPSLREILSYFTKQGFPVETVDIFERQDERSFWKVLGLTALPGAHGRRVAFANAYDEVRMFSRIYDAIRRLQDKGCERIVLGGMSGGFIFASRIVQYPLDEEIDGSQRIPAQAEVVGVFGVSPLLFYPSGVERLGAHPDRIPARIPVALVWGADDDIVPLGTLDNGLSLAKAHLHITIEVLRRSNFSAHKPVRHQFFGGKDFIGPLPNAFWHPQAEQAALQFVCDQIPALTDKKKRRSD